MSVPFGSHNGALVLFSGGMDSTVALFWALNYLAAPIHAITFNYGQRHIREVERARRIWDYACHYYPDKLGSRKEIGLSMAALGALSGSAPVAQYNHRPTDLEARNDPAFMPYRNLIFLSHAAQQAIALNCHTIVTGFRGGFPDCSKEFENHFVSLAARANPDWAISVGGPMHESRTSGVRLALELPYCMGAMAMTYTCFVGDERPCGKCLPCIRRAEGFAAAGISDPALSEDRH